MLLTRAYPTRSTPRAFAKHAWRAVGKIGVAWASLLAVACSEPEVHGGSEAPDAAGSSADAPADETTSNDDVASGRDGAPLVEGGPNPSDGSNALEVIPAAFTEENAPLRILRSGDTIDLLRAPQGGHVVLLAAQVRNASSTAANIRVRMRRPDTGFIVAEEKRTVAMVAVPDDPATMQPDLRTRSQVAHVPLCPDYDPIDVVAEPLDVEIEVTALYTDPPAVGSARLTLVPACRQASPEAQALCRCECEANYALGKCAVDARAP